MEIAGAVDSVVLCEYVRGILLPTLAMDILRTQYKTAAIAIIEIQGSSVTFLPPCRHDHNPIAKMWSNIKILVRGWAARTQRDFSPRHHTNI
jgi:transposase